MFVSVLLLLIQSSSHLNTIHKVSNSLIGKSIQHSDPIVTFMLNDPLNIISKVSDSLKVYL